MGAGNNQIHQGRILAYSAEKGRHQVLWDDGEDEWIDATKEPLKWHQDRLKTTGFSAGLPAGAESSRNLVCSAWIRFCQSSSMPRPESSWTNPQALLVFKTSWHAVIILYFINCVMAIFDVSWASAENCNVMSQGK